MQTIMSIVGYPFGWLMWAIYQVIPIYAVALIIFTLVTKAVLIPLAVKQQKSMAKTAMFTPKIKEIQKKYANNREKQNEELQKLYAENDYNPASGCLPLLIQMPILFGLIDVIYKPLTHILRLSSEVISSITTVAAQLSSTSGAISSYAVQILAMNSVKQNPAYFVANGIAQETVDLIANFKMNLLGLDLSQTPSLGWNWLIIIPILSGLTALATSLLSMKSNPSTADAGASSKMMMLMMPLMSLWFTFKVPAGVGFYWILSNVFSAIQSKILLKFYNPTEMAEKFQRESEEKKEAERLARIEAKKLAKASGAGAVEDEENLSQKELNRRKISEARRKAAEKYGDVYTEPEDEKKK